MSSLLKKVENVAAKLEELDAWLAQGDCASENILAPTLRSYASGLHLWRLSINRELVDIESKARKQGQCIYNFIHQIHIILISNYCTFLT